MVMRGPATTPEPPVEPESYRQVVSSPVVLLAALAALGASLASRTPAPPPPQAATVPPRPKVEAIPAPAPVTLAPAPPMPTPTPAPPQLDRAAVARAEAEVEAARHDRLWAEARAEHAAAALAQALLRSTAAALAEKTLAATLRDPSARIARATTRGAFVRSQRDRLKDEVAALAKAPKPRRALPIDPSPVATVTEGEEFHFEVRRDRIAFIDLERLLEKARDDARVRLRMAGGGATPIEATVGPVGPFSLQYIMGRTLSDSIGDLLDLRGPSYSLLGFEVVPEGDLRGETFDVALRPASAFSRAINRLNPPKATITLWIYPDGFALYRRLRDHLHARGFLVAARPLPFGIPIRGSPSGSFSAGQ
jgi:hypothetical protein